MLNKIKIENYKRISKPGVLLDRLALVNYMVGVNGSGKSSVIDYLYDNFKEETMLLKDSLTSVEVVNLVDFNSTCQTENVTEKWKKIYLDLVEKDNIITLNLLGYSSSLEGEKRDWQILDMDILTGVFQILNELAILDLENDIKLIKPENLEDEQLTGGENKIINIVYSILWSYKHKKSKIILLDEPENHLHPTWQKKIPMILDYLSINLNIQIFVATHSPFIISSCGELTDSKNTINKAIGKEYKPTQKVYFLKEGRVAAKRGNISNKGRNGYWGVKVTQIASTMLGAGLMDLVSKQKRVKSKMSPVLIICEGEGKKEDSKVYNIIFRNHEPAVLFVSSRGSSQVGRTFQILQEIKPGLSADFDMLMVRDRDHEFPTENSIEKYEEINDGSRVLRRRAIECYIFNSETAAAMMKKIGHTLSSKNHSILDKLNSTIQKETENEVTGNSYKRRLEKAFNIATYGMTDQYMKDSELSLMEKVATLIKPSMKCYKDLRKEIFKLSE